MLRSIWLVFVYIAFLGLGASTPFILALGYVWVDTFRPQEVAYIVLNQFPVALIMGAGAIGAYLVFDRREPPRLLLAGAVPALMAVWSTVTLVWAVAPDAAWQKWDWAFKTLAFAAFLPYVIRSRVQIEAMAQIYLFALAANFIPFGVKTLISGGGYGQNLGLVAGNAGLAEGGQLSTFCLMAIPIAYFLSKHGRLVPSAPIFKLVYLGIMILALVTALGTFERSALLGAGVLGIYMFMRSRQKLVFGLIMSVVIAVAAYTTSSKFFDRMNTIGTYQTDNSAMVRIMVWKWTLEFSTTHPLGGGFSAYVVNVIEVPGDGIHPPFVEHSRAFHSSYFEVLGEQGYPGLVMFLLAAGTTLFALRGLTKRARNIPHLAWCADMSDALQSGILVFMTSGAFVGLAFQPIFWYFIALSVSLREYVRRSQALDNLVTDPGWRGRAQGPAITGGPAVAGWQRK